MQLAIQLIVNTLCPHKLQHKNTVSHQVQLHMTVFMQLATHQLLVTQLQLPNVVCSELTGWLVSLWKLLYEIIIFHFPNMHQLLPSHTAMVIIFITACCGYQPELTTQCSFNFEGIFTHLPTYQQQAMYSARGSLQLVMINYVLYTNSYIVAVQ